MTKKRGLGSKRGLDVLMGNIKRERDLTAVAVMSDDVTTPKDANHLQHNKQESLIQIDVARLQSGKYQPRYNIKQEALTELADSIRQHGVMQPIVIRPLGDNELQSDEGVTHEIIAGERRWRAAKLAGLGVVPAIERVLTDEVAIALALIENIQREDLSVLEQAAALERFHTEFGMSHAMIADVVGKARTTVSNLLRLNALHDEVKALMMDNLLDMGHARTLLALPTEQQPIIAKKIVHAEMTVRDAEKLVKSILNPEPKPVRDGHHEIARLNQKLSDILGATVKLKQNKNGKGSMEIFFQSPDELTQLMSQLGVNG
ncbi:MAG: ParB/RepB/Spo0J family partition protein [Moraxella sp.]|uniref:ParB/RepB/Spo0J family partition protein n=1 Tax=Moraxella sp. TaxID=479 RepID=UPI0026DC0459|nr:ParB/RepB/Spo0J family partition protein [Moraxella sp.]MDO4450807.1 ParB/RepB/Spo0J family partition protein [Moraxella sp.]